MRSRGALVSLTLVATALLAAFADRLPVPLAVAVLAVTFLVVPGWCAARSLFGWASPETRAAVTLVLAPFLTGASVAALVLAGVPLALAARLVALAVAAWIGLEGLRPSAPDARTDGGTRVAYAAAGLWTLAVAAFLIGNRHLPLRADGWFHVGVTMQVVQRGLPPEDPYFAGLRLLYFWGMHAWAAAWLALAPRLTATTPLIAFNLSAMCAVVLAVAALARRMGAGPRGMALAAALATLGYSPFAWLIPVLRSMVGKVTGWAELSRDFGGGADGLLHNLTLWQLHESMGFFGDKGLVLTQFGMGMAFLPLAAIALTDLEERRDARTTVAYGALVAAALFVHALVGYVLLLLAGTYWLARAVDAARGDRLAPAVLVRLALAAAAAVALLAPYLFEITYGKQGEMARVHLTRPGIVTIIVAGALYVVPGIGWLGRNARVSRAAWIALVWATVLLALGLCLHLPENNQSKFDNLLFVLLAAPAAFVWDALLVSGPVHRRRAVAGGLLLGVVPTLAMAAWGFASERGQSPRSWHAPTPAVVQAMAWAHDHTLANAAFCDLGGGVDLVSLAGRSVVWGGYSGERNWGYSDAALAAHRDLAGSLCRGRDPGSPGAALLAALHRDVVVMTRATLPDSLSDHGLVAARPERFTLMWRNDEVAFWKVRVP